jgi:hypothetical protein
MEEGMLKKIGERMAEIMGVLGGIHGLFETLGGIHDKLPEGIKKKMAESLGLNTEAAEKTTDDESLFEKAIADGSLSPIERKAIMNYLGRLRKSNPRLAKEWVRWIHNTLVKFGQTRTNSSGQAGNKEIRKTTDYSEGIRIAENLFRDIASASDDTEREVFLTQRNIYVMEIKPSPAVEAVKKFAKKNWENFSSESSDDSVVAAKCRYEESKLKRKNSQGGQQ